MKRLFLPIQILVALVALPLALVCIAVVFWSQERIFRHGRDVWGYTRKPTTQ